MPHAPSANELERRKQVRIRMRGDLEITSQRYEGRTYYVVKDPVTLRYYRYTEREAFLVRLLDGRHTLADAQKRFEEQFRPDRLTLEDLEALARQLLRAGLAHNESPQAGRQLFERRTTRLRTGWWHTITNVLYIKVPLFDPDRLLATVLPGLGWIFTAWFGLASLASVLAALFLVAVHFDTFRQRLPGYQEFFSLQTVAYLWLALALVKVIHEFGHGLSCKAFGGECHEMGLLFLCLAPALYCNVSDAWTMPSKWKRMIISFAGIYVELMIAAIATFVWWNTETQPFVTNLSLALMVVCSVSTVIFNGNPLLRYDGYYVLLDWLEIPNLRERSNRYLTGLVLRHCLGVDVPRERFPMSAGRRAAFVAYAAISSVYRWVVTFGVLVFLAMFLKPYRLQVVSQLLAGAALLSMVGWPLYRLRKSVHERGRFPEMKTARVVGSVVLAGAVVAGFLLIPLPVSQIRQTGLIQFQEEAAEKVFVPESGILEAVRVRDGQHVEAGQELAVFRDADLWLKWQAACNGRDVRAAELLTVSRSEEAQAGAGADLRQLESVRAERDRFDVQARDCEKEFDRLGYDRNTQRFVLRAPRAGIVLGPPRPEEVGKRWDREQGTPFCTIGNPGRMRVLVPLSPADYRVLQEDLAESRGPRVTVLAQGLEGRTWRGRIAPLPLSEAGEIPVGLTNRAGGPVAVKPGPRSGSYLPLSQQYLVAVNLEVPAGAVYPGVLAQVKVRCRLRTCAWWVWRTLSSTFDLGLL